MPENPYIFLLGHSSIKPEEEIWLSLSDIQAVRREGNYTIVYLRGPSSRVFSITETPTEFWDQMNKCKTNL